MIQDTYIRKAKILRVIDGDTIDLDVDLGYRRHTIERVELNRINAPELKGDDRSKGLEAKAFIESLLPVGTEVTIQSYKTKSFGKWLVELYYIGENGEQLNLSDTLVEKGYATFIN